MTFQTFLCVLTVIKEAENQLNDLLEMMASDWLMRRAALPDGLLQK